MESQNCCPKINGSDTWGEAKRAVRCSSRFKCHLGLLVLLTLRAAEAAELMSFQAGSGGWHLGTLAVGNIVGDSGPEIVVPYRDEAGHWFINAFGADGTQMPGFPYAGQAEEMNASPTLEDLDGDGRDEILLTRAHRVIALRGNGSVYWSNAVTRLNYIPTGGYMTVTNGFHWSKDGAFISTLPEDAVFSSQVSSPIVADIDGDGLREVVTGWKIDPDSNGDAQDFNPFINDLFGFGEWGTVGETWSGGVVFLNSRTGARGHVYHLHQLVESGVVLGQADADGATEVYVLNDSDSVVGFDITQPHGFYGNGTLHKQFGKNQRFMGGAYQQGAEIHTVDLDGDGRAEVLVPTTQLNSLWQPSETILDDDGTILWRQWKRPVSFPLNQWLNNATMIPVNPDRDNRVDVLSFTHSHEIQFRSWNGVELVNRPGWPKSFFPLLPTPPVVGDVDGDGQEEIVIGTYDPAKNPSDGSLLVLGLDGGIRHSIPVPGGLKHVPTLADVTGDGGVEVIYRSLLGRIYVQNFGARHPGPVSWSTHRGNRHRDGNWNTSLFPAGTPLITSRQAGFRQLSFSWRSSSNSPPQSWQIFRAENPEGPFTPLATLDSQKNEFTDHLVLPGAQYLYEIGAVYGNDVLRSPPLALQASLNGNLIANGGFEENDNSRWDKWFTGSIDWTNMVETTGSVHWGAKAMEVVLLNKGNNGSIAQFEQYGTPDAFLPVSPGQLYSFGCFFRNNGISRQSEHWLEWGSTCTGEDTNVRPPRPYPNYFTPPFTAGIGASSWTYANRTFVLPDGFPNVELGHRFTIESAGSGSICLDDVFFRPLPSLAAPDWIDLIPFGSSWRHREDAIENDWFRKEFADSGWPEGIAKFGAGSGPNNIATRLVSSKAAYHFRHTFLIPENMLPLEELLLSGTCTEEGDRTPEIYLNGERILTSGIDITASQGNEVLHFDLTPFSDRLNAGTNVIAVMLPNLWQNSWDDVAFDLRLRAIAGTPPHARIQSITRESTDVTIGLWVPNAGNWRVESSDTLAAPVWRWVDSVTNKTSGLMWLKDTGQRGRENPLRVPTRFYRVRRE